MIFFLHRNSDTYYGRSARLQMFLKDRKTGRLNTAGASGELLGEDDAKPQGRWAAVWSVLCVILAGIAVCLTATAVWEARNWSELEIEELVHQLSTLDGVGGHMVTQYLVCCVLPGCVSAAVLGIVLFRYKNAAAAGIGVICSLCLIGGLLVYGWNLLDVGEYLRNINTESDYIERYYADPGDVELTFPEKKRNLIYIWLESVETTFADVEHGGAFAENVIPELTALAEENVSFTGTVGGVNGGLSLTGATWTAGAMFAHTSGLPLKIPIADSAMGHQEQFFPGIVSLGDILLEQGYHQALLIGSDASFGGRRQYFTQHGDYEIWDYPYSKETGEIPSDYRVWWGYEDEKLFQFAREHLAELAEADEPFNLSILTVDTHFTDGYVCRLCSDEFGGDQYSNVMACSSRQVAGFVDWVRQQPFYENTTIVLCGDHTTMDVDYCDGVSGDYPRRVFTTIINPAAEIADSTASKYREYTTFDMFPTTLAAMGVKIEGERLGLGTNLFSRKSTLLERDGLARLEQELKRQSDFLNARSGIDPEMYRISEEFANTCVLLDVELKGDSLVYTLSGLEEIEPDFSRIEVFAEHMSGDTRTTLWSRQAERQPDGCYTVDMPVEVLGEQQSFHIHFYGTAGGSRIKMDTGYVYSLTDRTLVREDDVRTDE